MAKSPSIPRDQRNRREAGRDRDLSATVKKKGAIHRPRGDPDVDRDEKAASSTLRRNVSHQQNVQDR
ncbi:MAG TPA: hypothetical protein VG407_02345 [Caulobacteraceae bacterium]|jgi:hypothetical protein|nr:hypothetical protein [Caulobacteraceae bacterium]